MDEAKKQLRLSVIMARNLYRRAELNQRRRIKRLQFRVEKRTIHALQGVRELLDFDPTRDLKARLESHCPAVEPKVPKRHRQPQAPQRADKTASTSSWSRKSAIHTSRAAAEYDKQPARRDIPASGRADSRSNPTARSTHSGSTSEPRVSQTADGITAGRGQIRTSARESRLQAIEQKGVMAASATLPQVRSDAPSSEPADKERNQRPSLAERRRQWARSRRNDNRVQQPAQGTDEQRVEETSLDNNIDIRKPERPTAGKTIQAKSGTTAAVAGNRRLTQTDSNPLPAGARDVQTETATTRAAVQIDPLESETVNPADDGQAPSQPGGSRDFASQRNEIELARELAEAVYLHGIDRT